VTGVWEPAVLHAVNVQWMTR